ncbi:MAG: hypothetical protein LBQ61_08345 [Spirochaetales bacterium]|nr:hypothetical protein [Spirochaetales bacterium]
MDDEKKLTDQKIIKFLGILRIELEDLAYDLQKLQELTRARAEEGEITHFVLLENLAFIQKEIMGVSKILPALEKFPPGKYQTLDEFADYFFDYCQNNRTNVDIPKSVYEMIKRKINKVKQFMQD